MVLNFPLFGGVALITGTKTDNWNQNWLVYNLHCNLSQGNTQKKFGNSQNLWNFGNFLYTMSINVNIEICIAAFANIIMQQLLIKWRRLQNRDSWRSEWRTSCDSRYWFDLGGHTTYFKVMDSSYQTHLCNLVSNPTGFVIFLKVDFHKVVPSHWLCATGNTCTILKQDSFSTKAWMKNYQKWWRFDENVTIN